MATKAAKAPAKKISAPSGKAAAKAPSGSKQMPSLPVGIPKAPKGKEIIHGSKVSFQGKIFSVHTDDVEEPNGVRATRDVVRHNGSVVVLAVDDSTNPGDPLIVLERQYRHAAGQYLLEIPAGRVEPGEKTLAAAKRELIEETGYRARKWQRLVRYYASPGFVGEWMEIFLATGIIAGDAHPEDDEKIDIHLVPLSRIIRMALAGEIHDGKTLVGAMLYAEQLRAKK